MVYVIDIDGTICETEKGNYENSTPIQKRIYRVNELYDDGHTIILNTARGMGRTKNDAKAAKDMFEDLTKKQLDKLGIRYHHLFLGKPAGDIYVDDKGIKDEDFFTN